MLRELAHKTAQQIISEGRVNEIVNGSPVTRAWLYNVAAKKCDPTCSKVDQLISAAGVDLSEFFKK